MPQRLNATSRIRMVKAGWFESLSDEQRKGYLEEHPDSKYAKQGKGKAKDDGYGIWDNGKWKPMTKEQFEKDMHPDYVKKYGGKGPDAAPKSDKEYDKVVKKELGIKDKPKAKPKKKKPGKVHQFFKDLLKGPDVKF